MAENPPEAKKPAEAAATGEKSAPVKSPEQPVAEQKEAAERLAARQAELDKALLEAARKGNVSELRDLLGKGAALLANNDGNTALFYAAQYGRRAAVEFLLEAGIPLNVKNRIGSTPITGAAGGGHREVADMLYQLGGNPREKNATGMSAIDYARSAGYIDMAEMLLLPRNEAEVSFSRQTGDRTLQEIFNFMHRERLTLIRKGENGPVEAIQRDGFDKVSDETRLRDAFALYQKRGGAITEAAIFPSKQQGAAPIAKERKSRLPWRRG